MNQNLTDITLLIDRSGSMSSIRHDMIGGMNVLLDSQRALPGDANLTVAIFDTEYTKVRSATPIRDVASLTAADLVPRGGTALLDAVGRCVVETGDRLGAMPESERPGKVLFIIVTDGLENRSREYGGAKIKEMIKHQSEVYSWDFVYLGANQDAFAVAASMGISSGNALNYTATAAGVASVANRATASAANYRSGNAERGSFFGGAEKKS
jgi:uncharacterized protein with von Willebrand factor type A (vWA) domain